MKRIDIRLTAIILITLMLIGAVAGCNNGSDNDVLDGNANGNNGSALGGNAAGISTYKPPEYVYVAQTLQLGDDVGHVTAITAAGDKLYLAASTGENVQYGNSGITSTGIYTMSADGTALAKLNAYEPPADKPQGASGGVKINEINITSAGDIIVTESWEFYKFNVPDGMDVQGDALWGYAEHFGSGSAVRQLDSSGNEKSRIFEKTIQAGEAGYVNIQATGIDSRDNVYVAVFNEQTFGTDISVYDSSGNKQFKLETEAQFDRLPRLSDGSVAFACDKIDETGSFKLALQTIDFDVSGFSAEIELPSAIKDSFYRFSSGGSLGGSGTADSGSVDVLFSDSVGVYGYTAGEESVARLLSWLECDLVVYSIDSVIMLSDGNMLAASTANQEFYILTKKPYSEVSDKTIITLATFSLGNIRYEVAEFNRTNQNYRIHVIDYSDIDGSVGDGITRLATEINSGKIPDILDVSKLPYQQYTSKGLFADLYEFIDADPSVGRADYVQGALKAAEIDDKLYQLFPMFLVNTVCGNPSVLGGSGSWTVDEFRKVMDAHPEANMAFGFSLDRETFLQAVILSGMDEYVDWTAGAAHFDTDDFAWLLEFSKKLPAQETGETNSRDYYSWDVEQAIADGSQIMAQMSAQHFMNYAGMRLSFGGQLSCKGFPNSGGIVSTISAHSSFSIMQHSPNKDGAWEFLKFVTGEDWQKDNTWGNLPINKKVFDREAAGSLGLEFGLTQRFNPDGSIADVNGKVTQQDIDGLIALIDSASGISGWTLDETMWNIISEETSDFYKDVHNAEETARLIQNRVSILVSERS